MALAQVERVVLHREKEWLDHLTVLAASVTVVFHCYFLQVGFVQDVAKLATHVEFVLVVLRVEKLVQRDLVLFWFLWSVDMTFLKIKLSSNLCNKMPLTGSRNFNLLLFLPFVIFKI